MTGRVDHRDREQISIPLSREMREQIRRAAEADGRSVANLCRLWLQCGLAEFDDQGGARAA
jgi:Arc-like DNA binding domain